MCLEQEDKPKFKNTNPKIKIQKLKISKSPFSQTQQYHQILKPHSNKSIQKYNTTNPNKKISNSKSLSHLSLAYCFLSSPSFRPCFLNQTSLSLRQCRSAIFFSISQTGGGGFAHWWFFFLPIFEMVFVIGMLNRCGFELVVGY